MADRRSATDLAFTGAAGAGGGTLLVELASHLPENNPWKPWILLVAPSASIAISALYSWATRYIHEALTDRKWEAVERRSRKTLETSLGNPNTSPEHKAEVRQALEQLERIAIQRIIEQVNAINSPPERQVKKH